MRILIGWTVGAACATVIVTGLSAFPAPAQEAKNDRREIGQDSSKIWGDRREIAKDTRDIHGDQKELRASRQQLREAYKSGDPAAIKAAREHYQKSRGGLRGELRDRRQDARDLRQGKQDRSEDVPDLHEDRRQAQIRQAE